MATQTAQLQASARPELGSRANKRLRDTGQIPAVLYGHKEAVVPLKLRKKEISVYLAHGTHVFDLTLDGKTQKVLIKDVQYDHLGIEVLHVDFARVSLDEKVEITVPLELKGTPKGEADGGFSFSTLRIGRARDGGKHRAQVADHGQRAIGNVAVMDVALARFRGTGGVREVLVEVLAEVSAPDEVAPKIAVRERDDVQALVREERQRNDEPFIALATGDGAADEPLAEEFQDAVVARAGEMHPGVHAQESVGG